MRKFILPKSIFGIFTVILLAVLAVEGVVKGVTLFFTAQEVNCVPIALDKSSNGKIILSLNCGEERTANLFDADIVLSYANDPSSVSSLSCKINGHGTVSCE